MKMPETLHQWMEAMEEYIEESHEHVDPPVLNRATTLDEFLEDFVLFCSNGGLEGMEFTTVSAT